MFTSLQTNKLLVNPTAKQQMCFVLKSSNKDRVMDWLDIVTDMPGKHEDTVCMYQHYIWCYSMIYNVVIVIIMYLR